MTPRFSKQQLHEWIQRKLAAYERDFGFTRANGWSQVEGKGEELNRAYGQYSQLQDLLDVFCSNCQAWPRG